MPKLNYARLKLFKNRITNLSKCYATQDIIKIYITRKLAIIRRKQSYLSRSNVSTMGAAPRVPRFQGAVSTGRKIVGTRVFESPKKREGFYRGESRIEGHAREIRDQTEGTENVSLKRCKKIDRSYSRFGRKGGSTSPRDLPWRRGHASMAAFLLFYHSFFSTLFRLLSFTLSCSLFLQLSHSLDRKSVV